MNWTLKDEESSKEEGWDVHGRPSLSPATFHPWGCEMKTENTLFCSSQGTESRPGRNYRKRELCPKGGIINYQGWPWTWGTLKTTRQCACCLWGTASVLAWGLRSVGWAWNGCSSTQPSSNSGILYIFQALAQQGFIQCCQEKEWLQPCWSVSSFIVLASLPPNRQQHRTPLHPRPLRTPSTSFDNSKYLPAFY